MRICIFLRNCEPTITVVAFLWLNALRPFWVMYVSLFIEGESYDHSQRWCSPWTHLSMLCIFGQWRQSARGTRPIHNICISLFLLCAFDDTFTHMYIDVLGHYFTHFKDRFELMFKWEEKTSGDVKIIQSNGQPICCNQIGFYRTRNFRFGLFFKSERVWIWTLGVPNRYWTWNLNPEI